jgi:FkbM family methyltransferase
MRLADRIKLRLRFGLWARLRADRHASYYLSHSQFGEDMIARALLEDAPRGTYVDVGAHHPVYYSNTYHFYRRGWSGVNIDAAPGTRELFEALRPRDVNVEACVGPAEGQRVELFVFDRPALNTVDPRRAEQLQREHGARIVRRVEMRTVTLARLLERHLAGKTIDLMSIDLEGLDERIVAGHDWGRWRPRVLIVERQGIDLDRIGADPLARHLSESAGYRVRGVAGASVVMST